MTRTPYTSARGGGGNIRDDAGAVSLPLHPLGDANPEVAGDDVDDARDLRCAGIGPANELHHELAHVLVVGTPRHRSRRREHCAELGHLGVPRLDLRLEHLGMHLELLGTPSEARVVSRVIDGIRAPELLVLPLQLAELPHGDSGAPRLEIFRHRGARC